MPRPDEEHNNDDDDDDDGDGRTAADVAVSSSSSSSSALLLEDVAIDAEEEGKLSPFPSAVAAINANSNGSFSIKFNASVTVIFVEAPVDERGEMMVRATRDDNARSLELDVPIALLVLLAAAFKTACARRPPLHGNLCRWLVRSFTA